MTNHILDNCNEASEENLVYDWACSKGIVPKKYKGEGLNGPNSHKLVKLANELTEILPAHLKPYGYALQQLHGVIEACFGRVLTLIRVGILVRLEGGGGWKVPTAFFKLFLPHFIIQINQTWSQMKAGFIIQLWSL